jgi:hypothetical protein
VSIPILEVLRDTVMITCIVLIPPLLILDIMVQRWQGYRTQQAILTRLEALMNRPVSAVSKDSNSDTERRVERLEGGILVLNERISNDTELRTMMLENNRLLNDFIAAMRAGPVSPIVDISPVNSVNLQDLQVQVVQKARRSPKLEQAIKWLRENRHEGMTTREMGVQAGVSHTLIAQAINELHNNS